MVAKYDAQRLSIAAGGGFYNAPPGTAAWFYFKVKIRTFAGFYPSAETVADSDL